MFLVSPPHSLIQYNPDHAHNLPMFRREPIRILVQPYSGYLLFAEIQDIFHNRFSHPQPLFFLFLSSPSWDCSIGRRTPARPVYW